LQLRVQLLESTHLLTLTGAGGVCKNRLGLALRGGRTTPKIVEALLGPIRTTSDLCSNGHGNCSGAVAVCF
jgi:hypothetical protein